MTDLLALALAAMDDADALAVLDDALEEAGGRDEWRRLCSRMPYEDGVDIGALHRGRARAIAAVLLFGDWPATMPPLAVRCAGLSLAAGILRELRAMRSRLEMEAEARRASLAASSSPRRGVCDACHGNGTQELFPRERCPWCEGRGWLGEDPSPHGQ